ncbi:hypothetical protein M406DRAFT_354513 [Cryphonectria parasitica EP155]|uniref:Secreted protein n=1 Tax=Cryphonectria parasitica (strain ATCC 38755 / EP155) TaxID=660469 RepID=A0A9P5CVE4_CRYP1|nr:uncharacterized protein M406DRAFT_354513 [Cryphonectria parasitica EP155]KAF3770645.1 hypothetical protein M406DRAFT_354513 [Cryphonectria parasitica EP155]
MMCIIGIYLRLSKSVVAAFPPPVSETQSSLWDECCILSHAVLSLVDIWPPSAAYWSLSGSKFPPASEQLVPRTHLTRETETWRG